VRGTINLDDPDREANAKGRALVPMNERKRAPGTSGGSPAGDDPLCH
jgi:hypothetical protein